MGARYLSRLKRGKIRKPKPYSVFDIEGRNWIEFLVLGWYNGKEYKTFYSIKEFIEFVMTTKEESIYAHFGGIYDFLFIIKSAIKDTGYFIENMIPRGSGFLCFDLVERDANNNIKTKKVFRDSSAILPFSLKKITESFGVAHKKQDLDVSNLQEVTPQVLEYLKYDNIGLYESLEAYFNWDLIEEAGPAFTMAGQALRVFRLFMEDDFPPLNDVEDAFVRKSYFGGRTEIFRPEFNNRSKGNKRKKIRGYDVNSLYPTVMEENDFPTEFKFMTRQYYPKEMGFYEVTVEVPEDMYLPPLPYVDRKTHKLIFPTGRFSGVYSTIEIEYARSLGVKIIKTGKGALFYNGGPIFKRYINTLYKKRMEAQERGDGVGNILTKLLMNALYGRFALVKQREQLVFDDFSEGLKFHSELKFDNEDYEGQVVVNLMTKPVTLETYSNVAISSWVTSLSRIHMHKIMNPIHKDLYYTDTDSLFTTKKLKTSSLLGGLKLEYEEDEAVFLLPKTYVLESKGKGFKKIAMKGFDKKKISHFTYEDFYTALEGDLRHMNAEHDAKMAKFRTAARKGDFLSMVKGHKRQLRSLYDKRLVIKKGNTWDTTPLHINAE